MGAPDAGAGFFADMWPQARAIAEANPHVKLVYTAVGGGKAGSDPFAPQGAAEVRKAVALLAEEGLSPAATARVIARLAGWSRSDVYDLVVGDKEDERN